MDHNAIFEAIRGAVAGGAIYWIASAFLGTMPQPKPDERWYGWAYNFGQAIAANLNRVGEKKP